MARDRMPRNGESDLALHVPNQGLMAIKAWGLRVLPTGGRVGRGCVTFYTTDLSRHEWETLYHRAFNAEGMILLGADPVHRELHVKLTSLKFYFDTVANQRPFMRLVMEVRHE